MKLLAENGFSSDEIDGTYFLDGDHYSVEGHRIVASQLYNYLSSYYSFEARDLLPGNDYSPALALGMEGSTRSRREQCKSC